MPDPPPLAQSILDVIGSTPLVELNRSVAPLGLRGRLLAKLESVNPGLRSGPSRGGRWKCLSTL
jgi:cysteine synthase